MIRFEVPENVILWQCAALTRARPSPREGASPPPRVACLLFNTLALVVLLHAGAAQANGTENYNASYAQPAKVKKCTNKATTREDMRGCTRITYETCID